jgi:hypothetical protein
MRRMSAALRLGAPKPHTISRSVICATASRQKLSIKLPIPYERFSWRTFNEFEIVLR